MSTNEVTEVKAVRPFGMKDKLSYAAGDLGCNLSFALKGYLSLFYCQYIGLSVTHWAAIILIMQIWDAINDPLIGGLIDSVRVGKHGKYKPWMFWGALLLVVSSCMLFIPIPDAAYWVKIVVACLGYAAWDMSYTMVNVPYGALNAVITDDGVERSTLATWRSIGALVANLVLMVVVPFLVYDEADNLIGENVFFVAIACGLLAFVVFMYMIRNTVERVTPPTVEKEKFNYFKAIKAFFTNGPLLAMTGVAMLMLILSSGLGTANLVLYQSYFNAASYSGLVGLLAYIPMFIILPFIKPLSKKFGNKNISAWPLLLTVAIGFIMVVVPLPQNVTGMLIWGALGSLGFLGVAIAMTIGWAMVADCIDYGEYKTGVRDEGTSYALYSFGRKLAQGLGASLILILLLVVGYDEELDANQTIETATNVKALIGWVYGIASAGMFVLLKFAYSLNDKRMAEVRAALAERREAAGIVVEEMDISQYKD